MAKNKTHSKILAKAKKKSKGAWKRARKAAPRAKGASLPGGIVNGIAKLNSYDIKEDKNGNPYVTITGIVHEPEECESMKATIMHFISESQTKSIEDKLEALSSDLQLLGADVSETDVDDWGNVLADLCEEGPFFKFNTWKPDDDSNAFVFIQGLAEDWEDEDPDDDEEEEEDDDDEIEDEEEEEEGDDEEEEEDDDEDEDDEGEDDEEGDDELGEGDRVLVDNPEEDEEPWEGSIVSIDGDTALIATDDDEEYEEPVDCLTPADAEDEEEEEEEEEDDDDDDDDDDDPWVPAVEEIYGYKATARSKVADCAVTDCDIEEETVTLKRLNDKKVFKNVSWDKLEASD